MLLLVVMMSDYVNCGQVPNVVRPVVSVHRDCVRNQRSVEVTVRVIHVHVLMALLVTTVVMLSESRAMTLHAAVSSVVCL